MSEREMWKLVHLLYLYSKPAISRAARNRPTNQTRSRSWDGRIPHSPI